MRARSLRDIAADVFAVGSSLLIVVAAAVDAHYTNDLPIGVYFVAAVVVSVLGCLALLWRRQWPVHIAVGLMVISLFTDFAGLATLFAIFAVGVRRSLRTTLLVCAGHIAVVVTYYLRASVIAAEQIAYITFSIVVIVIVALWARWAKNRRRHLSELREQARSTAALAESEAERLRSLERERIAREMHDVLAHRISMVTLHAGALEVRPDATPEEVARTAGVIRVSAREALDDLREILGVLRSADGGESEPGDKQRPQPSVADLPQLIAGAQAGGQDIQYTKAIDDPAAIPDSLGRTLYRVTQEGLTNARKHAPTEPVTVSVEQSAEEIHIHLYNTLMRHAIAAPGARQGLIGMEERVQLAGGTLRHGVRRGADGQPEFHLEVWIPCRQ